MPTVETLAVGLWFAGLLLLLLGILTGIARLAIYRHTGDLTLPLIRGVLPLLTGMLLLAVSLYLFDVRRDVLAVWLALAGILVAVTLWRHR